MSFLQFFKDFWNYEESLYVREKLAYGHSIGRRHCYEQTNRLIYWERYFDASTSLRELTKEHIKEFQLFLRKSLAPATVNAVLSAGTIALSWAAEQGILSANPAEGLKKFSGPSKKRDILTQSEVKQIFSIPWSDDRSRIGNLLAMTTGLRASEIVALKKEDIESNRIIVRHSWSFADGSVLKNRSIVKLFLSFLHFFLCLQISY
ncbi:MAG: phage integrase SAM-like domain-containing protein [Spirochaetales bacterium]|nr:phage integrase SAM-like domain-containing protein [Spirochaetales bacterium]